MSRRSPRHIALLMAREIDRQDGAPEDDDYVSEWVPEHSCGGAGDPTCAACWMDSYDTAVREEGSALEAAQALGVAVDQANRDEAARARLDALMRCTCPSGDGSLRWPCPTHPPTTDPTSGGQDA